MIDSIARNRLVQAQTASIFSSIFSELNKLNALIGLSSTYQTQTLSNDLKKIEEVMGEQTKTLSEINQKDTKEEIQIATNNLEEIKKILPQLEKNVLLLEEIKTQISIKPDPIHFPDKTEISGSVDINSIKQPLEVTVKNPSKLIIPEKTTVSGKVDVGIIDNLPPVSITNLGEITNALSVMVTNLNSSLYSLMKSSKVEIPKEFNISKPVEVVNFPDLLEAIEELKQGVQLLVNKEGANGPSEVTVTNFPIQKVPTPVTHISINSLRGAVLTTPITITSTATALPSSPLANRRAIMVYNNSSTTIYIGNNTVTTATGMPVPTSSYSPILDMGQYMTLYGIIATGTANVRVLEVSDTNSGS